MVPSRAKEDKMKSRRIISAIVVFGAALIVGTATAQLTPLGLKAYGERLQGEARVYQNLQQGPTALGLKAWGERLQAEARVYQQRHSYAASKPKPEVTAAVQMARHFQHEDALYAAKPVTGQTPTPVEAMAVHFQHEDALYRASAPTSGRSALAAQVATSNGFDWSDAGIGALVGFALAAGCVGALLIGRRFRRIRFAAF
jgi:hypothetical protein